MTTISPVAMESLNLSQKFSMKLHKAFKKNLWAVVGTGIVITLLTGVIYVFKPAYLQLLEYKIYDVFLQKYSSGKTTGSVAIVDIDEYSIERFGQWPWPRYRVALLLQKIRMSGAAAVATDILFADPDNTSPVTLKKYLKKDLQVDIEFPGLPQGLMDNDKILAGVLEKGPFVTGFSFAFDADRKPRSRPLPKDLKAAIVNEPGSKKAHQYLFQAGDLIPPLPEFLHKDKYSGFMNTLTDRDGVVRRTPLFITYREKIYPQLSVAAMLAAFNESVPPPVIKVGKGGIESVKIAKTIVPLESNGSFIVNYRGPGHTFPYTSAWKILENDIGETNFNGKIVFLGTSAAGLKDIRVSPLDQVFPGVEVHANIVDNILSQDFIHRPDWTPGLELSLVILWGIISSFAIAAASSLLVLPVAAGLAFGSWYGGVLIFAKWHIWVSPFFPLIVLVLNFSILNMQKFWLSEKKKKFFRSAFSKYVSKTVVDQLAENPEKLSLKGEEKEVSILFSDIRSFTSISENLTPTQITSLLHEYFTPITKIIISNRGTHDKFIGDAVMCFWNAPLDVKDHRQLAIKSALQMLDELDALNKGFKRDFGIEIAIGIGIHSGNCMVGNLGSDEIFDYTIIGDNVNLCSRLEGLTKFYGVKVIASQAMIDAKPEDIIAQELDMVRVKGKDKPVHIYTLYPLTDENRKAVENEISLFNEALILYRKMDFKDAESLFSELRNKFPEKLLYSIYINRCRDFIKAPPSDSWDGVYSHTSK